MSRRAAFDPVLHIPRWSGNPVAIIEQINALGHADGQALRKFHRRQGIPVELWLARARHGTHMNKPGH